jgi:hypothetical protein
MKEFLKELRFDGRNSKRVRGKSDGRSVRDNSKQGQVA